MLRQIEKYFPLYIVLIAGVALMQPKLFLWIKPHIPLFLGLIMFCIGLTLNLTDFKQALNLRWQIVCLALLKYILLPMIALSSAYLLHLSRNDLIGLLVISACPGGTAASVMSYLSRSNVALTVTLTFFTTLLSPVVTPVIIYLFLHKHVPVPFKEMATTIFWIVLFPLVDGLVLRKFLGKKIDVLKPALPLASIVFISLIIACVVAIDRSKIIALPLLALSAVLINNIAGLIVGYVIAKTVFKFNEENSRAVSFEFGLLDTGLAVMLTTKFFGVATSLCAALFSAVQNITGSGLVEYFRSRKSQQIINRGNYDATT